jgi:hypothetical protein
MAEIAGLTLITPSSVAGSGVSLSGAKVVFTAATTININGVFSATHDNYLIIIRGVCASGTPSIRVRMRVSGTDATGSNYARQYLDADNTSVTGARSTSVTEANAVPMSDVARSGGHLYVYGPFLSQPTAMRGVSANGQNSAHITDHASTHSLSTSYDGITLFPSSSNITGALTVYGLSQ